MLELRHIRKDYPAGGEAVHALRGIDLQFRESEFVSILGPSGCGKTTMLNIIGGLDQYSHGDLVINGRSTKDFRDRDWDAYRNHSIGFVFQTYNLIPHQTVLQNVELALSLSGVSRTERRRRAKKVLEDVGLGDQLRKKPAEMSGGQMQRVAIARALVNDPDIILADEPTGALDTETSVQVMDVLREVARDRLVIMVTHNPDLAEKYSTRIIRMLDGVITDDSCPLSREELEAERERGREKSEQELRVKKPSMSMPTSFGLSLKNLFTKKGRTVLTSFAGSIGIIGIALIFAVSQGMTTYINAVQEDTLSSYPLTLEAQHMDMGSLLTTFMGTAASDEEHDLDAVYQKGMVYDMLNALNDLETNENDLAEFKKYIEAQREDPGSSLSQAVSGVQYTYELELPVYTESVDGAIIQTDSQALLQELMLEYFGADMSGMTAMGAASPMGGMAMGGSASLWQEMLPGDGGRLVSPALEKQYDVIYGSWPDEYDEVVVVVDEKNEIDDMTLYALGLKSKDDIDALAQAAIDGTHIEKNDLRWTYEQVCGLEFRTILPADCYTCDAAAGVWTDLRDTDAGLRYLYDKGLTLRVSGIIRPSPDAVSTMLTGTIGYTSALTAYAADHAGASAAVQAQLEDPSTDIFSGLPFRENTGSLTNDEKVAEFCRYIASLDEAGKAEAYVKIMSIPSDGELDAAVTAAMNGLTLADMEQTMLQALSAQMGMDESELADYIGALPDEDVREMYTQMVTERVKMEYAAKVAAQMETMEPAHLAAVLDAAMPGYTDEQMELWYDEVLTFSDSTCEENLRSLGVVDLSSPSTINLYAASFEDKDVIEAAIAAYNEDVEELEQITYTDYVGLMMSSVTTIINAITYVLIAFVAISLVVSSIMIGVITLISVQERTREIGILRALGASKKNVSSMFNAETVIIGFTSGLLGVVITHLLCLPINAVLHHFTGIANLRAFLPMDAGFVLIGVSVLLTLIAGVIPSRSAARKDPVVALRSE